MKVNLNIEEDDMFRQHVKSLIEGQVRHVLREQLSGIVAGEIAKLRLLQPNSPTLNDLVAAELKKQTAQKVTPSAIASAHVKAVPRRAGSGRGVRGIPSLCSLRGALRASYPLSVDTSLLCAPGEEAALPGFVGACCAFAAR